MATLYDREIEDSLLNKLSELWRQAGLNRSQVATNLGITEASIRYWFNGLGFQRTLARLRHCAAISGATLEIKITSKDGVESTF